EADRRPCPDFMLRPFRRLAAGGRGLSPQDLNSDASCATHPDGSSSAAAEINRATLNKRTAIVDPHYHRSSIVGVCNSNPRPKGKRPVRGGHGARVEPFPRCRSMSREFVAIVRRNLRLGGAL